MSEENVELYSRAHAAFNRRDLDAFLALCDPDVEFASGLLELEGGGPYRGHDGVRSWWQNLLSVFPDFGTDIDEVRDFGDLTVARLRLHGQGMKSDAPTEGRQWQVAEWRQKKCIRWRVFVSEAEALEAAGLSE